MRHGWLLLISACGAPELSLSFEVPTTYRDAIQTLRLTTYVVPAAAPFGCANLEFDDVDPDVLRLSRVGQVDLQDEDNIALPPLNRLEQKVFLVEGRDAADDPVVFGCAELGEIESDTNLEVPSHPATRVVLDEVPRLSQAMPDRPVALLVTDALGIPLQGVAARWQVLGAGGTDAEGQVSSDGAGRILLVPPLPSQPGPFVLDVQVRWSEADPEPITGFILPQPEEILIPGRVLDYRAGAVGPGGASGIVALTSADAGAVKLVTLYRNNTGELLQRVSQSIVGANPQLGLIEKKQGERDRPIVITSEGWTEVALDGALTARGYNPPVLSGPPTAVFAYGGCLPTDAPQVLVSYDFGSAVSYNDQGGLIQLLPLLDLDVLAAGCVASEGGSASVSRALVAGFGFDLGLGLLADNGNTLAEGSWLAISQGMSFAPAIGGGPFLLGTQLSVNDVVVARLSLALDDDAVTPVIRGLDPVPSTPILSLGGDLDADALMDVAALFTRTPAIPGGPRQPAIWASLARELRGRRISSDADVATPAFRNPLLLMVDLDQDDFDDLVVAERTGRDVATSQTRLQVYAMGLRVR